MCGRLHRDDVDDEIGKEMPSTIEMVANFQQLLVDTPRSYNMAPGNNAPVLVENRDGLVEPRPMHWGLVRPWSKPGMPTPSNARAETILDKPMFRDLLATKRCIVPVNGYYEWMKLGSKKVPYHIRVKDQKTICIAGIYDAWIGDRGELQASYTMITTTPADSIAHIHDRMPVILEMDDIATWLSRRVRDLDVIMPLLRPYPSGDMEFNPIGNRINDVSNDDADVLTPVPEVRQPSLLEV